MKKFFLGFLAGGIVLVLGALICLRLGLADVRADAPTPAWKTRWMFASVHASIRRTLPANLKSPRTVWALASFLRRINNLPPGVWERVQANKTPGSSVN